MADRLITVFGGSGFVGRHLVNKLTSDGWRVRVAVRDPESAKFLKPLGDLGQVSVVAASLLNADSVKRACQGAEAVVNLVGILSESGKASFQAIHADGAALVAESAKAAGVKTLVQMSALGAAPDSPSRYARSKAEGEDRVRAAFPGAVMAPKTGSITALPPWPACCPLCSISARMPLASAVARRVFPASISLARAAPSSSRFMSGTSPWRL
jgi:NADH dehydrogenase